MVTIHIKNIEGKTVLPVPGTKLASGYDIVATDDPTIVGEHVEVDGKIFYRRINYIEYRTALYIAPQASHKFQHQTREVYHTLIHPRSSVRKYNLLLANSIGLLDNDYRGEVLVSFKYIWQPENFMFMEKNYILGEVDYERIYKKGDKIGQLVAEASNPIEFVFVSDLDATERGAGGHGSTDKPPTDKPPIIADPILNLYQKAGGVPIRKKYIDEVRERQGNE